MTNPNVPATEVKGEPDPFDVLSAELHRVADDIATLVDSGLPAPRQFQLNIQPGTHLSDDDLTARAVDAMAQALLGINGKVERMSSGTYFYNTDHLRRGPLEVAIYQGVSTEWALKNDVAAAKAELAEREAELEKARARVAELEKARKPLVSDELLRAAPASWNEREGRWDYSDGDETGLAYTRADSEADDPTPVSPARVPLHTGSVVADGVLVTDPETITVYFSFGHGQTDPDTGENLLDKYVTIVGPSHEACRQAMFASRYGRNWSFDYIAGEPRTEEWIPRWTEHDRIDATDAATDPAVQ